MTAANPPVLTLGSMRALDGSGAPSPWTLPAHHLVTHGFVTGMTGSGKTGLLVVMIEEALRAGVPVLVLDVKGDLANLLLAFPTFDPAHFAPWVDTTSPEARGRTPDEIAVELASGRERALDAWGIDAAALARYHAGTAFRLITPGGTGGEPLHVLSALERRSRHWDDDPETALGALGAAVSLVLRLLGRDPDPASSREHVLLSVLAERRLRAGGNADLASLVHDLEDPPVKEIGALGIDAFIPRGERRVLAAALNALLASPVFATWRAGATLDVGEWMASRADGRVPATIVSVAHLDDDERALVLGVLLEEVLAWVRGLPGAGGLRALVVFDEVYGYLPPHPAKPATKGPLVALMKQARAFGVGVVVATQNPMDVDYRALGNAGLWCIGRLLTDADRARVVEGLGGEVGAGGARGVGATVKRLTARWFVARNVHAGSDGSALLVQPRWAMSWLKGPMTRAELRRAGQGSAKQLPARG